MVLASRHHEPQTVREEEDSRDILSAALSTLSTSGPAGFFRDSIAPGGLKIPVSWQEAPSPSLRAISSLPGLPSKPRPSGIYTQAGASLSNPVFAPDTSFSTNWNCMSTPYIPPPMFSGHAATGGGGPPPPDGGGGGPDDPGDPGDDGEGDDGGSLPDLPYHTDSIGYFERRAMGQWDRQKKRHTGSIG